MLEYTGQTKANSEGVHTVVDSDLESCLRRPKSASEQDYRKLFEITKHCFNQKTPQATCDEIPEFDSQDDSFLLRPSLCTNKSSRQSYEIVKEEKQSEKELITPLNEKDKHLIVKSDQGLCKLQGIKMKSGGFYKGYWYRRKPHHMGEYLFADQSRYLGDWNNGYASGRGEYFDADGGHYQGEFYQNCMQGTGVYKYADGTIYNGMVYPYHQGQWMNDKYHGVGIETKNDSQYKGKFQNGLKHGQGTMVFFNQEKYQGSFVNGLFEGKGVLIWPDGRRYEGDWQKGVMHGQGMLQWPDGRLYIGQYENDKRQGFGTFQYPDGRKYAGYWMNGLQHGSGEFTEYHGQIMKGVWREGKLFSHY
ncbi:unnamed protein product (macronuclear) [Paramecium tetraurelia]|uniref:MORN repeat protein n=1 Tax=Paramecium tetraurelia TaxID=5888 RepID=A0E2W2_PARTE|nr:uncharacterized protein GSPATT00022801001 [Paramecium tetraurelia]CAK89629.1 unnamed protein product [Paramecium tetraurelia]|eukprot:XP_001457026.1 hypothetical protein (macronuclear) [Paramecium tetraurelia strain d4-2]